MGSKGSTMTPTAQTMGISNTSSTYTPNPQAMSAYNGVLNTAQNVGQIPYTPYQGQMVAGFSPDQLAAFQGVREMQGIADPYINAATGMVANASNALTPDAFGNTVQSYYNPYQQNVIDAAMANMQEMNASQQNQLTGNAIMRGAMGGDRAGIARAELARQQAMTNNTALSNLQQQGWQDAVKNALSGVGAQQSGAYSLGQLGSMLQNARTSGLSALLGAGAQQQALGQQQLQSAYDQFLMAQGFPYQQTGWLAGITGAIAPNMGGTTNSTTTGTQQQQQAGPSLGGQIAGFGTTALAMAPYVAKAAPYVASGLSSLGSAAAAALPALATFSDRRAKTDVQSLGDGLYAYRYKGDPKSYPKVIGEMAQEVEKTEPDRVVDFGGLKGLLPRRAAADGGFMDYFDPQYLNERMKSQWVSTDDEQSNPQDGPLRARGGPVERDRGPSGLGAVSWIPDVQLQPGHAVIPQAEAAKFPDLPSANKGDSSSQGGLGGLTDALNKAGGSEGFGKMLDGLFAKDPIQLPGAATPSPVGTVVPPDATGIGPGISSLYALGGRVGYAEGGAPGGLYASWLANAGVGKGESGLGALASKSYGPPSLSSGDKAPIGYFSTLDSRRIDPRTGLYALAPSIDNDWGKSAYYMPKYAEGGRVGYAEGGGETDLDPYMGALAKGESGGERDPYAAIGPETRRGDHAYGKYQIIGSNIPSWSQEAGLGRLTPDQFLADKDAQEKIARYKFGQYVKQTGSPVEAARMWFGGPKWREHAGAKDAFGTSIPQYAARFERNLGSSGSPLAYAAAEGSAAGSGLGAIDRHMGPSAGFTREATAPLAYAETAGPRSAAGGNSSNVAAPSEAEDKGGLFNFSPEVQQGLLAAGLGMLSSRSPWASVAIGEGGLKGLEAYQNAANRGSENKVRDAQLQHYKTEDEKARFEMEQLRAQAERLKRFQEMYQGNSPYSAPGGGGAGAPAAGGEGSGPSDALETRLAQIERLIPLAPNEDERQKLGLERTAIIDRLKRRDERVTDLTPEEAKKIGVDPAVTGPAQRTGTGKLEFPMRPGAQVNIDQKGQTEFAKESQKGLAKEFADVANEAYTARENLAMIEQLGELSKDFDTGARAAATQWLANYGISFDDPEKVGKIQAYQSIIDKLTPQQRVAGSGATSDYEMRSFKNALPSLIKTPEGNAIVEDTLKALAESKIARADIANQARTGEISPSEAIKKLRDLPSPMAQFKEFQKARKESPAPASGGAGTPAPAGKPQDLKPVPDTVMEEARKHISSGRMTRAQVAEQLRAKGYDPSAFVNE